MKINLIFCLLLILFADCCNSLYAQDKKRLPSLNYQMSQFELGIRYLKLGNTFREGKDWNLAEKNIGQGLRILRKYNSKYWIATAYEFYGYLYRDMGYPDEAKRYLRKAKEIFENIITQENGSQDAISKALSKVDDKSKNEEYEELLSENKNIKIRNSYLLKKIEDLEQKINELNDKVDILLARIDEKEKKAKAGLKERGVAYNDEIVFDNQGHSGTGNKSYKNIFGSSKGYNSNLSKGTNTGGTVILMPTVGFGSTYGLGEASFPPLSLTINFRLSNKYEIGLFGGYSTESYLGGNLSYQIIGIRIMYILWKGNNWDVSSSAMLGYNSFSSSGYTENLSMNALLYGGIIDFRYFLTSNLGLFLEAGYGLTYVSGGIAIKF